MIKCNVPKGKGRGGRVMRQRCANCGWLSVNPSGAMFCGYSDERTWEDYSCMAWKDNEPKTNADRIRSMTDEELAEYIASDPMDDICDNNCYNDPDKMCKECTLKWLQEEIKGG